MHCTVDDHRRHCCRLLKKKASSRNSAHRARSDSCIRQCGPSTTSPWCLQHQHTGKNPSLALQPYAEQTNQSSFSAQGGVLSPALFNYYLADSPTPPPNIKLIKFADDITIYTSGPVVADLINGLNIYLSQVLNYINNKKLTVSMAKYTGTLFMPDTHEHYLNPQVKLADQVLLLEKNLKMLGVMLDTHSTFTQHCNNIAVKVQQCNNVLKALAASTWGCDKETMLTTYQAIGRSILSYSCPVCTPSLKDANWSLLQLAQNSVLRIPTCCLKLADDAELHQEARELPVRQHNKLISQLFAIECHHLCHRPPDDRTERRRSLMGRSKSNIQQYHAEEPLSNTTPKSHSATPATSRQSAASTKMRSELPLKAAHQSFLMADRRPLLKPNSHCQ